MNKGIIEISSLEKNIEQIKFFKNEEQKILNKMSDKFAEINLYYQSNNTKLILNHVDYYKNLYLKIEEKRTEYINILNQVISNYIFTSKEIKNLFEKGNE